MGMSILLKLFPQSFQTTLLNSTDNITKFTEEYAARVGTPNQFLPFITSDDSRDIASDMEVKDDSRGDETGQHDQVRID